MPAPVKQPKPTVAIVMGSQSDLPIMQDAATILLSMGIPYELTIISAHRTPLRLVSYAEQAYKRGIKVIIAGAGGAAHLPGMLASLTILPIIGVPILSSNSIDGWDSVLSILQMPKGVPVATVALNGAANAGLLAAQIIATSHTATAKALIAYKRKMDKEVQAKVIHLKKTWPNTFDN